jgi:hypothetical protein
MMQEARFIAWVHSERGECEARVGQPIRWRGHADSRGRYAPWRTGRTVLSVTDGPLCWRVHLDPSEPSDGWVDSIMCGNDVDVH